MLTLREVLAHADEKESRYWEMITNQIVLTTVQVFRTNDLLLGSPLFVGIF